MSSRVWPRNWVSNPPSPARQPVRVRPSCPSCCPKKQNDAHRPPLSLFPSLSHARAPPPSLPFSSQLSTGFGTVDTTAQPGGLSGNGPVSETDPGGRSHTASGEVPPPGSPGFPGEEGPGLVPDGSGLEAPPEDPVVSPLVEVPGVPLQPGAGPQARGGSASVGAVAALRPTDPEVDPAGLDPAAAAALARAGLLGAGGRAASNLFVPALGAVDPATEAPADAAVREGVDPFFSLDRDGDGENDTWVNPDGTIAGGLANYGKNHVKERITITLDSPGGKGDALICHFPSGKKDSGGGVDPYNVRPLKLPAPAADLLLAKDAGNGFDFEAPLPGDRIFGPGCVSYDARCSFGNNGIPCSGHGICASTIPNTCLCMNGFKTCRNDSNGCETNVNLDPDNCGTCGRACNTTATGGNEICCQGQCLDPEGDGGPTIACGRCGAVCATIPTIQTGSCTNAACNVTCDSPNLDVCQALQPGTGISLPICVDLTVNPLFCGNCSYACPFDPHGRTRCGPFGTGGSTACSVECSPSFPTQCGTVGDPSNPANDPSSGLRPTSNCVNLLNDPDNCGGCGIDCPQSGNAITTCSVSSVTGRPACSFTCNPGLLPCTNPVTGQPFCANIFGFDPFNCGGCGFRCSAGFTCFQGTCLPGFPFIGGGSGFFSGPLSLLDTAGLKHANASTALVKKGKPAGPTPEELADQRPSALRPALLAPATPTHGDIAVFPSYPEWWDNPAAAAAAGVPGAAAVAAAPPGGSPGAVPKLQAYLAARPDLASGTARLSDVLAEQRAALEAAPALPPNVDVAQCTWATADGGGEEGAAAAQKGVGKAKLAGAPAGRAAAAFKPASPPTPKVEVFLKASLPTAEGEVLGDGGGAPTKALGPAAPSPPRDRAAEAAAYGYAPPSPPKAPRGAAAPASRRGAVAAGGGVDDARFQTANILARQFEGEQGKAEEEAEQEAAAKAVARAATPAPAALLLAKVSGPSKAPAPAPAARPPSTAAVTAGVVSVADGTSSVQARKATDAAGSVAGAAERAGVGSARAAAAAARGVVDAPEAPAKGGGGGGAFPKELGN